MIRKFTTSLALAAGLLGTTSLVAQAQTTGETRTPPRACAPGGRSLTVTVTGFSNTTGTVRAQLYGPGAAQFLAKGAWTMRIEQNRRHDGPMQFCFPIDRPGEYAVAIRHDANDNHASDWNDGGGFTGNPHLSLLKLKPPFAKTSVTVGDAPVRQSVVMQYRHGLGIGPLAP
jgi:uncharacterized protein (DUF2141 family)